MKSFLLSKISDMCDTADNAADKTAIHVTQLMHGPAKLYHPHHCTVHSVLILIHMHCAQLKRGPKIFKKGTEGGPDFEQKGDLKGTKRGPKRGPKT